MKRQLLFLFALQICSAFQIVAQEAPVEQEFNQWSIEGSIGLTKPYSNFSPGYYTATPSPFVGDIGVRYMFNEFVGLKSSFAYNSFSEASTSSKFNTDEYRLDLQGVLNLGRVLSFENWTKRINILVHAGVGAGYIAYDIANPEDDYIGNAITGITGQYRLTSRLVLTADGSFMANIRQNNSFNGGAPNDKRLGSVFNGTVGVSYYFGKKEKHADWYLRAVEEKVFVNNKIAELETKLQTIQAEKKESDPAIQELAKKVDALAKKPATVATTSVDNGDVIKQLINDGFADIYFNFNGTIVDNASLSSISLLKSYLAKHSDAKLQVLGYADEKGSDKYNMALSVKRAQTVSKLLEAAGVSKNSMSVEGKGEDKVLSKKSLETSQLSRRVSFYIK